MVNPEAALKGKKPNQRMKVPVAARTELWPGIGLLVHFFVLSSNVKRPRRGPIIHAPAKAADPPFEKKEGNYFNNE
jgi:hypothetical protein